MCIVTAIGGGAVSDRGICERCGETLRARDARAMPGPGGRGGMIGNLSPLSWGKTSNMLALGDQEERDGDGG
jgi:hypothetical protein